MAFDRKTRRSLLFGVTLITILMVVFGTVSLSSFLNSKPYIFVTYWAICFVFAMLVLMLAFIDMRRVREEFKARQVELDAELAKIVSDTEAIANNAQTTDPE